MRNRKLLTLALVAMLGWLLPASAASILNGGFEHPVLDVPSMDITPGSGLLTGWDLWSGNVSLYRNSATTPTLEGEQSLRILNGASLELEQVFPTSPGQAYELSYKLAGPPGGYAVLNYEVTGFSSLAVVTTITDAQPPGSSLFTLAFTSDSTLTSLLLFTVGDPSRQGEEVAVLDSVTIREASVPEIPSGVLAALGMLGFIVIRMSRRR